MDSAEAEQIAKAAGWAWDECAEEFRLNDTGDEYDDLWMGARGDWIGLCKAACLPEREPDEEPSPDFNAPSLREQYEAAWAEKQSLRR